MKHPVPSVGILLGCLLSFVVGMVAGCEAIIGDRELDDLAIGAGIDSLGFVKVNPYRRIDTRNGTILSAKSTRCWTIGNQVPNSASAVSINLTAVSPQGNGYLTVFPFNSGDKSVPKVSTLNYRAGVNVANGAMVALGSSGKFCVYSLARSHVIVDVAGYFPTKQAFSPVALYRRVDTRNSSVLKANSKRCWVVAGRDGIPKTAIGVAVNLVAVKPAARGYLTAYPFDINNSSVPGTSSLNYGPGDVVANGAIVMLGDGGKLCVYSKAQTDVLLDVSGYFGDSASYNPIAPTRVLDTRPSSEPIAESTRCFTAGGKFGIPKTATAVAVNLTAVQPSGSGFLLIRPAGNAGINTSTLNYAAGDIRANNAIVQLGAFGRICVYTKTNADYVVDIVGYWPGNVDPDPIAHPHTFEVSDRSGLLSALEKASAGDVVKIAPTAVIDLSNHKDIRIPGGVTMEGGRKSGTPGALIKTNERAVLPLGATWGLFRTAGNGVIVRNMRLQGPDGEISASSVMGGAINVKHDNVLVRGNEIYNWPAYGVSTSGTANAIIEHNYIHENIRTGRGYGVVVGSTDTPTVIRFNTFGRNRHSVAGNGSGSYEVHHNRFANTSSAGVHSIIDMHGKNEHTLDNSTHKAGDDIHIHHNDIEYTSTQQALIGIRGIPTNAAIIEDNCVARSDSTWVQQWDMTAYPSPQSGQSCYEKRGTWLCHIPVWGAAMKNIVVRNNIMGTTASCR